VTRSKYGELEVQAARSVLMELVHLLGEYRDDLVLVGGWVPYFLIPNKTKPHIGSTDVDLAVNHRRIKADVYKTIQALLLSRGYRQGLQPFIFIRTVEVRGKKVNVEVDFMAGEYEGTGTTHRTQQVQREFRARKARGCDLAFQMSREIAIKGVLPDGSLDSMAVRVASIVPFLVMKGMAIDRRLKEKDAYDIFYCIKNYPGGTDALIVDFMPHMEHGLVREGLQKIARHFSSIRNLGPRYVVDFEELTAEEEREHLARDAYERVRDFLEKLGIVQKDQVG